MIEHRVAFIALNVLRLWSIISVCSFVGAGVWVMARDISAIRQIDARFDGHPRFPTETEAQLVGWLPEQVSGLFWSQIQTAIMISLAVFSVAADLSDLAPCNAFLGRVGATQLMYESSSTALGILNCFLAISLLSRYLDPVPFAVSQSLFYSGISCIGIGLLGGNLPKAMRNPWRSQDRFEKANKPSTY